VKTFPTKKRINTSWGSDALHTKVKEGSGQEISDLLEEGRILALINMRE